MEGPFWTYNVNVAVCTYKVWPLTHRHYMIHLKQIFVKRSATFLTAATILFPDLMLQAHRVTDTS